MTDDGGSVTIFSDYVDIAISNAPLTAPAQTAIDTTEAAGYPLPVFAAPVFSGVVATFDDANPTGPLSDFDDHN